MQESNPTKKLIQYLKKNIAKGYTEDSLRFALIRQGYSRTMVDRAIQQLHRELAQKAPILKEKPVITHQIIDETNRPITIKKSWWKRIFG